MILAPGRAGLVELARIFPTLRDCPLDNGLNFDKLKDWVYETYGDDEGVMQVVYFIAHLFDSENTFNLRRALESWDDDHLDVFKRWAENPRFW